MVTQHMTTQQTKTMAQASDPPTEKCCSYRALSALLLLCLYVSVLVYLCCIVLSLYLFVVFNEAQLQTSNIQLKADLDALNNKQNALMKKYEEDKEEQTQMSIVSAAVCLSGSEYLPNHMFIAKDFGNLETTCEAMSRQFGFTATAQCVARMQPYASIMAAFGCCDGKIIHFSVFFFLCRIPYTCIIIYIWRQHPLRGLIYHHHIKCM